MHTSFPYLGGQYHLHTSKSVSQRCMLGNSLSHLQFSSLYHTVTLLFRLGYTVTFEVKTPYCFGIPSVF